MGCNLRLRTGVSFVISKWEHGHGPEAKMNVSYRPRLKPICGKCVGEPVKARGGSRKATWSST